MLIKEKYDQGQDFAHLEILRLFGHHQHLFKCGRCNQALANEL